MFQKKMVGMIAPMNRDERIPEFDHPKLILSHSTAMAYLSSLDPERKDAAHPSRENPLHEASATREALSGINLEFPGFGGKPLELLVGNPNRVHGSADTIAHSCIKEMPSGSFWKTGKWLYVVSPELCFLQMAPTLSQAKLVRFGFDLCARRFIDPVSRKLRKRKPLTTVADISNYIESVTYLRGAKKASRALKWIKDRSDSPKESDLALLVGYPIARGGYAFSDFEMGLEVNPGRYSCLAEKGHFEIDIAFSKERVGIEYYGEEEHPDPAKDRRRLDALEALGWRMVVIDKTRLYSPEAFDVAMGQVAFHLGRRIRKSPDWNMRMLEVRKEIGLIDNS